MLHMLEPEEGPRIHLLPVRVDGAEVRQDLVALLAGWVEAACAAAIGDHEADDRLPHFLELRRRGLEVCPRGGLLWCRFVYVFVWLPPFVFHNV